MIYLNFIIDLIITNTTPIKTYCISYNIDKNTIIDIIITGLIIDLYSKKILFNTIILILIYYLSELLKKNKYKNIIIYLLYFFITYFIYSYNTQYLIITFIKSSIFQLVYINIYKHIINWW